MRRGLLTIIGATLAFLLAGEVGARALSDDLPTPIRYHSLEAQMKVDRMDELADEGGAALAFVGTSIVYDVDPSLFPEQTGGRTTAYNAALGSGLPALSVPWALEVVLPRLRPDVLVLGLGSLDLSAGSGGELFGRAFLDSAGGKRDAGTEGMLDTVSRWLDERSALWEHRSDLRDPKVVLDALRGRDTEIDDRVAATLQPTGRPTFGQEQRFEDRLQAGGGNLANWSLGLDSAAHLKRLITEARAEGVKVVLVNMPTTQDYIDRHPNGADDYQLYLDFLGAFAAEQGVPLLDFHEMSDHDLYADEVHMNLKGAQQFTRALIAAFEDLEIL